MIFDDAAIDRILAAVGTKLPPNLDRVALAVDLERVAVRYHSQRLHRDLPTGKQIQAPFRRMRKAAQTLCEAFPNDWADGFRTEYTDEEGGHLSSYTASPGGWFLTILAGAAREAKGIPSEWFHSQDYEQRQKHDGVAREVRDTLAGVLSGLHAMIPWLEKAEELTAGDVLENQRPLADCLTAAHEALFGDWLATVYRTHFGRDPGVSRSKEGGKPNGPYVRFTLYVAKVMQVAKANGEPYGSEMIHRSLRLHWNGKVA